MILLSKEFVSKQRRGLIRSSTQSNIKTIQSNIKTIFILKTSKQYSAYVVNENAIAEILAPPRKVQQETNFKNFIINHQQRTPRCIQTA